MSKRWIKYLFVSCAAFAAFILRAGYAIADPPDYVCDRVEEVLVPGNGSYIYPCPCCTCVDYNPGPQQNLIVGTKLNVCVKDVNECTVPCKTETIYDYAYVWCDPYECFACACWWQIPESRHPCDFCFEI